MRRKQSWLRGTLDRGLESVGLKKKRIIDVPWQRQETSHVTSEAGPSRFQTLNPVYWYRKLEADAARYNMAGSIRTATQGSIFGDTFQKGFDTFTEKNQELSNKLDKERGHKEGSPAEYHRAITGAFRELQGSSVRFPADVIRLVRGFSPVIMTHSLTLQESEFLKKLVREHKPQNALDCGTGFACYGAMIMSDASFNRDINIIAIDSDSVQANVAKEVALRMQPGTVTVKEADVVQYFSKPPTMYKFDFLLLDHKCSRFLSTLEHLRKTEWLQKGCIVVTRLFPTGPAADDSSQFLSEISRNKHFKGMHGPPSSALFVTRYVG
eukprot:Rhum_TRINITY_DN2835_c0_g2::Rhum_TRINITY_DN2835_c0_g2_i1::g.8561::m.8561